MITIKYVVMLAFTAGCASTPHTKPEDMSAAEHRAAAMRDAEQARALAREDPLVGRDDGPHESASRESGEAAEHWRFAAEHGAAARALLATEATACSGVSASERQVNVFLPLDRIASVTPLHWRSNDEAAGAAIALGRDPSLTEARLRQQVRCHVAHAATLGYQGPEMGESPLSLKGIRAQVVSSSDGELTVSIVSDDPATAREVLRRAQALLANAPR